MPFDPLPESLSDLCGDRRPERPRAVEFGCGDGVLLGLLRSRGLWCVGLDRSRPSQGTVADVVGDARRPPLCAGSLDLIIAGNLVRHLLPASGAIGFLDDWLGLLRPGGSVFILEDEPTEQTPAALNHRDLQAFLARLDPRQRGPLISLAAFRARLPRALDLRVTEAGVRDNRWPQDATRIIALLESGRPAPGSEAASLTASIRRHGLACGRQWWLRLRNDDHGK